MIQRWSVGGVKGVTEFKSKRGRWCWWKDVLALEKKLEISELEFKAARNGWKDAHQIARAFQSQLETADKEIAMLRKGCPYEEENERLVEQLDEARRLAQWTPITESKPQTGLPVLIVWSGKPQHIAYARMGIGFDCVDGYEWYTAFDVGRDPIPDDQVTHWMPWPIAPPTEAARKEQP